MKSVFSEDICNVEMVTGKPDLLTYSDQMQKLRKHILQWLELKMKG